MKFSSPERELRETGRYERAAPKGRRSGAKGASKIVPKVHGLLCRAVGPNKKRVKINPEGMWFNVSGLKTPHKESQNKSRRDVVERVRL